MALGGPWGLCKVVTELGWLLGAGNCLLLISTGTGLFIVREVGRSAAMAALQVGDSVQGDPQTQLGRLSGSPLMVVSVLCPP